MKSWHVLTEIVSLHERPGEFKRKLLGVLKNAGVTFFWPEPTRCTPMEIRDGLLCRGEESWCWTVNGPDNLPELLADKDIIIKVNKS